MPRKQIETVRGQAKHQSVRKFHSSFITAITWKQPKCSINVGNRWRAHARIKRTKRPGETPPAPCCLASSVLRVSSNLVLKRPHSKKKALGADAHSLRLLHSCLRYQRKRHLWLRERTKFGVRACGQASADRVGRPGSITEKAGPAVNFLLVNATHARHENNNLANPMHF